MKLHSSLFITCYAILVQAYAFSDRLLKKREISSLSNIGKFDEIEGSGIPPLISNKQKGENAQGVIEWEGSGVSPDDEDGDVIEGSGDQNDEIDEMGDTPVTSSSVPTNLLNTTPITTTTTHRSSFDIHDLQFETDEDVAIEEIQTTTTVAVVTVRTWTTTSRRPSQQLTPLISVGKTTQPSVFDEKHNIPFDPLLEPGVLAGLIGGVVIGILAIILLVMFIVYRMRKKDEGSYALDEPKQPPHYSYAYQKASTKEFYA